MYIGNLSLIVILVSVMCTSLLATSLLSHTVESRTEEILDTSNNNLKISMEAPDSWISGTASQTVPDLNWRLNALDSFDRDSNTFFLIVNLPTVAKLFLSLEQKNAIFSLILSQFVTVKSESDITFADGSSGHSISISVTPEQLQRLNAPFDKGLDIVLIFTQQHGRSYAVVYGTPLGEMAKFENTFQSMTDSVQFGPVDVSSTKSQDTGSQFSNYESNSEENDAIASSQTNDSVPKLINNSVPKLINST